MTKIYFASHQYGNNIFWSAINLSSSAQKGDLLADAILEKTQYFSLKVDESEHSESSCTEGTY